MSGHECGLFSTSVGKICQRNETHFKTGKRYNKVSHPDPNPCNSSVEQKLLKISYYDRLATSLFHSLLCLTPPLFLSSGHAILGYKPLALDGNPNIFINKNVTTIRKTFEKVGFKVTEEQIDVGGAYIENYLALHLRH